ncbi:hypothetical protein BD626DRAFT_636282 [Schizophyllum amplum]|uniref:Uncharacterized protein n=1 Tax=Schizophyllum amplum TaxID=97359 RepID=A0A550BTJ6_9AGAR|nr:hypothetical protein BD626DRAFT_636282 [Auriculariopsis ampla]
MPRYGLVSDAPQDPSTKTSTDHLSPKATQIESEGHHLSAEDQSPVSRLPMELLSEIFLHFVSEKLDFEIPALVATTVALVCVAWRAAAHGTAQLWTFISSRQTKVRLDDQLRYSAALPLHLTHWDYVSPPHVTLPRFVDGVGAHMRRVQSFDFWSSCASLAAIPVQNMPALACARIDLSREYRPGALDFLANATALNELSVQVRYTMTSHTQAVRPPSLPSLTRLTLSVDRDVRPEWYLSTVAQCGAHLTFLNVTFAPHSHEDQPLVLGFTPGILVLPQLRTLKLENQNHQMLAYMRAPQLESIVLTAVNEYQRTGDPFVFFRRLLQYAPTPSVRTLDLRDISISDPSALFACLALLPDLNRMAVTWRDGGGAPMMFHHKGLLTDELFDRMTGATERTPLVPRLTSVDFNIDDRNPRTFSEQALRRFIRSRRAPSVRGGCSVAALEEVRVAGIYDSDNDFDCDGDRDGAVHSVE